MLKPTLNPTPEPTRSGFTLLEVMVAVAILALSLTAIFSSEAGAIKMAYRSRKMGVATLLVRCKMGEIEEEIAKLGLPAVYDSGSDACCEDAPIEGYECDWEVDPILLPETMFMTGEENQDPAAQKENAAKAAAAAQGDPNAPGIPGATPGIPGAAPGIPGAMPGIPGAMPGMPGALPPGAGTLPPGGAASNDPMGGMSKVDPQQMLAGGALGGIASMAMSMVYPMLKPAFEAQIRRATITVRWKEGTVEHSFDVTQYLVADPPALSAEQAQQVGQGLQQQNGIAPASGATTPSAPVTK